MFQRVSMSDDEFLRLFKRVSKKIILAGCGVSKDVEACIEGRIRNALEHRKEQLKNADTEEDKKFFKQRVHLLNNLLKMNFARDVAIKFNPHTHTSDERRILPRINCGYNQNVSL